MGWLGRCRILIGTFFHRARVEQALDEEVRSYVEMLADEKMEHGLPPEAARRAARLESGGLEQVKEEVRSARAGALVEIFVRDLAYAFRVLRRSPGFTAAAVLTLALGIGANSAIFSIVNAVLLRPLPYRDSSRIVTIWEKNEPLAAELTKKLSRFSWTSGRFPVSGPNFLLWRETTRSLEQMAACDLEANRRYALTGADEPQEVVGARVTAGLFPLLGIPPLLGRTFSEQEDKPGGNPVVMISYGLWLRRFGADQGVIGRNLLLDGRAFTVVGVMPARFDFPAQTEVWLPLALGTNDWDLERTSRHIIVIAKLGQATPASRAQSELDALAAGIEQEYPSSNKGWGVALVPLQEYLVGNTGRRLPILMGAVSLVLLIACANVANLMLVRAEVRKKEIAIRIALGAGRTRVLRQLLSESVLIALLGGAVALIILRWGMDVLISISPDTLISRAPIGVDWRVLCFTASIALLTGVIFGIVPALRGTHLDVNGTLKDTGPASGKGRAGARLRGPFVVAQVALALVLLIGAGLMCDTFLNLQAVPRGFEPRDVLSMRISLPAYRYSEPKRVAFWDELLTTLGTTSGIESAGTVFPLPFSGAQQSIGFSIEGRTDDGISANYRTVTPGYFRTMGIPLVAGRLFTERESVDTPWKVVINETMAHRFWPKDNPIGKRIAIFQRDRHPPSCEIIGIVGDVKHAGLDAEAGPEMYVPFFQKPWYRTMYLVVRQAKQGGVGTIASVRSRVWAIDREQPVEDVFTMEQLLGRSTGERRFFLLLLSLFAGLALVLAFVGIYGVVSYSVTQRTREIGIRVALGARQKDVIAMVLRHSTALLLAGIGIGLGAALVLTSVLTSLLFGVSARDPYTIATTTLLLAVAAMLASYLPARRALKVDLIRELRQE